MPRYEYRNIQPLPQAEKAFLDWIQKLDEQFSNRDIEHRCTVVRNTLHELYLGRPYSDPAPGAPLATTTALPASARSPRMMFVEENRGQREPPTRRSERFTDKRPSVPPCWSGMEVPTPMS